jgi:predicted nucleic acid-binding protein
MTMRVLVDTNVLVDVVVERQPFYMDSVAIWTLAEQGQVTGLVSAISFTNIYYIVRRLEDVKKARRALHLVRDTFQVAECDQQAINQAIDVKVKDFEDAVQYVSAVRASADCLVSRNPRHFPTAKECPVLTPAEFLATYQQP